LEPHNGAALVSYAALNVALGRPDAARATLPALARLAGRDSLLLLAHATLTQWTEPPERAVETYAGLLVLNPTLAGTTFWRDGGFRQANFDRIVERALARVPEVAGDGAAARSLRSSINLYSGRGAPDAAEVRAALTERPDDAGLRVAAGRLLLASPATLDEAGTVLREAVRIKGDDPAARAALGDWHARTGNLAAARREWTAASYLGDAGATVSLGDSFAPGAVPTAIRRRAERQLTGAEIARFYQIFQTARFTFQRQEPNPIILPGDWLLALPDDVARWKQAIEAWK
jgi:predicted Zn-dependent protease